MGVSFNIEKDDNGRLLQGRIADNGVGFDMDKPPVWRGLAELQKDFIRAGGQLEVTAYPKQGTNIRFCLPLS